MRLSIRKSLAPTIYSFGGRSFAWRNSKISRYCKLLKYILNYGKPGNSYPAYTCMPCPLEQDTKTKNWLNSAISAGHVASGLTFLTHPYFSVEEYILLICENR